MIWEKKIFVCLSMILCLSVCVCRGDGKYTRLCKLFAFKEIIRIFEKYLHFWKISAFKENIRGYEVWGLREKSGSKENCLVMHSISLLCQNVRLKRQLRRCSCAASMCPKVCGGELLVWRIFFLHFISRIFYHQSFAPIGLKKITLPLIGWSNISASVFVIF